MGRLLWHRMSVPYTHFSEDLKNFSANGIFFAQNDDLILMHRALPESLMRFYSNIGVIPQKILIGEVQMNGTLTAEMAKNIAGQQADFFMYSEFEKDFVKKHGLTLNTAYAPYDDFVGKYEFKTLCEYCGLSTPRHRHNLRKRSHAIKYDLFSLFRSGVKRAIIKSNSSVSGFNTKLLTPREFLSTLVGDVRPSKQVNINDEHFFVEEWHDDVTAAPSIQFFITGERVSECSVHNQLFFENRRTYRGCQSEQWLPKKIVALVKSEGMRIADEYARRGYRGHLGLNAIVTKSRNLLWLEANPRRVMSSYPFEMINKIAPGQPYVSYRVFKQGWKQSSVEQLLNELQTILFDSKTKVGVIPFDMHLGAQGSAAILFTADDQAEIFKLIDYVNNI